MKYFIEESTLTGIGDAIREKNGTSDLIPVTALADAIINLPSGGGDLPEEALTVNGDMNYRFYRNNWNWFIEAYGNQIKTNTITSCVSMFYYCTELETIPFVLNGLITAGTCELTSIFQNCQILKSIPAMKTFRPATLRYMFSNCYNLREIPEGFAADWDWSGLWNRPYDAADSIFSSCYSLRYIDSNFLKNARNATTSSSYSPYQYTFSNCYSLDEINDLAVLRSAPTKNMFSSIVSNCGRLKNMTFETENGTPIVVSWTSQTIDLSSYVGYSNGTDKILNYNSGITADKQVTDDASYQALKDDPDWFTTNINYSRYNHDSAVNTINSLPDTSATGSNTIKFKGASGANTDGGAINTLTEEEIAVATAKGWTVTLA